MKRWLITATLLLTATFFFATACSSQPTPTPPVNTVPTSSISTVVPFPTLLPTVIVPLPTNVPETVAPTTPPTRAAANPSRPPATRFAAPVQIEPKTSAVFKDGNDIKFVYTSVGRLEPNQCYLLHIELAVPQMEKGNRGDDFLDQANCGDQGPAGKELTFVLYRGKFTNSPNYGTILAQVNDLAPEARLLKMTWTVRAVQNKGPAGDGVHFNTVALSPNSPLVEFDFQP